MKDFILWLIYCIFLMTITFLIYWFITQDIEFASMTMKERGGFIFNEVAVFIVSIPTYMLIKLMFDV